MVQLADRDRAGRRVERRRVRAHAARPLTANPRTRDAELRAMTRALKAAAALIHRRALVWTHARKRRDRRLRAAHERHRRAIQRHERHATNCLQRRVVRDVERSSSPLRPWSRLSSPLSNPMQTSACHRERTSSHHATLTSKPPAGAQRRLRSLRLSHCRHAASRPATSCGSTALDASTSGIDAPCGSSSARRATRPGSRS